MFQDTLDFLYIDSKIQIN